MLSEEYLDNRNEAKVLYYSKYLYKVLYEFQWGFKTEPLDDDENGKIENEETH